jgi:hypothetical protein
LEAQEDGEMIDLVITVLNETKVVDGIETRVVEERESEDGELVEISRNYFAVCKPMMYSTLEKTSTTMKMVK